MEGYALEAVIGYISKREGVVAVEPAELSPATVVTVVQQIGFHSNVACDTFGKCDRTKNLYNLSLGT